ncbi:hypothetical protein DYBT9275_00844 [Dyadobacter sp. CECT 9275]|uniref:Uncharacterized protein n=1 Tax=Dyadobacter helix TaxID=2822344 RepID=A0A916J879_9BACT|nr:DUF937 domain-containing protein [Dyadobacter sp. CECT 9275]CAG4991862.1 hypothetical protein DYBT9275_00844 [Dyadobacter sp. CECT 9275]
MPVNILNQVKNYLSSSVIDEISLFLNEKPANVQLAFDKIFPALLGGVLKKSSDTSGAEQIQKVLHNQDESVWLNNLAAVLKDSVEFKRFMSLGSQFVPMLIGRKSNGVIRTVAAMCGIRKSSAVSLLSLGASVLLGVLGKNYKTRGMELAGLIGLVMSQRNFVLAGLSEGLGHVMKFTSLGDFKGSQRETYRSGVAYYPSHSSSKMLVWVLGAFLVVSMILFLQTCGNRF